MLRTYETQPQVLVHVGDTPAVCHNLTCNFTYSVPVGEVVEYSFDNSTNTLVVNGTDLPTNIDDIRYVEFAHSKCKIQDIKTVNASYSITNMTHFPCNSTHNSTNNNRRRLQKINPIPSKNN